MRIVQLEIENIRGVKHGRVVLPDHCVLLGRNDVGKTTIAEGLALLAGKERLTKPLCDWDFHGGSPTPASRFTLIATITGFGDGITQDVTAFPQWFLGERSARPVWWLEQTGEVSTAVDPPADGRLAAQIAVAGRYDEESSEFDTIRYFYDGPVDPFIEDHRRVPVDRLRDLGIFLLPSGREWDRVLGFGSSSFLKLLREYGGVPGTAVEDLKKELRTPTTRIEDAAGLSDILRAAEKELRSFLLMDTAGRLVYRSTSLDVLSVLRSLVPHVTTGETFLLPVARHGAGMIALQTFLILLAFAQHRRNAGRDFLFIAEEPELHLHPSLHRRLVSRIRATSSQSIVTTHSPAVASHYGPSETLYVRNRDGELTAEPLRREPIAALPRNSVRKLYLDFRQSFYDSLMGGVIIIPEGTSDHHWLSLWHRVAEASLDVARDLQLTSLTFLPTADAAVGDSFHEVSRFREDAVPLIDGDAAGDGYLAELLTQAPPPKYILRYGKGASIECVSAWILEPTLASPGPHVADLMRTASDRSLRRLQEALIHSKKDRELHECLAWEALETPAAVMRAGELLQDLALLASGKSPLNVGWASHATAGGTIVYTAGYITRV